MICMICMICARCSLAFVPLFGKILRVMNVEAHATHRWMPNIIKLKKCCGTHNASGALAEVDIADNGNQSGCVDVPAVCPVDSLGVCS